MRPPTGRSNMLRAALATARFAASIALGRRLAPWSLDWMLSAMLATRAEFGALEERASTASREVAIDEKTRRAIQLRRMRELVRQARHTAYYARELEAAGVDERRAGWSAFDRISVTPKAALRDDPDAFVHREARVVLRTATTGTTGRPTTVCFSAHELLTLSALSAISFLARGRHRSERCRADLLEPASDRHHHVRGSLCASGSNRRGHRCSSTSGHACPTRRTPLACPTTRAASVSSRAIRRISAS